MQRPVVVESIPFPEDECELFAPLAARPWSMWLDSASPRHGGRWGIMVAEPAATVVYRGGRTEVTRDGRTQSLSDDPLAVLRTLLGPMQVPCPHGVPFCGGAVGYFAYDLGRPWVGLPTKEDGGDGLPLMAVGIYQHALVLDRHERRAWRINGGPPRHDGAHADEPFRTLGPVTPEVTETGYRCAIERIQHYLREGDCYQVNYAQCFTVPVAGSSWDAYRRLRQINPAPFAAYLNTPFGAVLSASPERFLKVTDGRVETRPIKGTRPRAADPARDRALANELAASAKDRAENVMIVDLLRNDLGRSCRIGSVRVPELYAVESFATVHHLVSTVIGRLAPDRDALDLLRDCFPGGSITGAPKKRAMEIIDELEGSPRGVYCGSIGYVGFDGRMDTNIAIRTLVHHEGVVRFCAGGGIVIDSDWEAEYRESLDKAAGMVALFR